MPECHYGLDAGFLQLTAHVDIALDRFFIVLPWLRLHPGPLDAEAVVGHSDLFQSCQIFVKVTPRVESISDDGSLLLINKKIPVADVVILITRLLSPVLVLKAAGGDSPGEGSVAS